MKVNVFAQSEAFKDVAVVEVEATAGHTVLREALLALLPVGVNHDEILVFIEDSDEDDPLSTLKEIEDGLRVHLHGLKGIEVNVGFNARDVERTFRPSSTLRRIKHWATDALGITRSDAAELMLQIHGTNDRPDPDTHLGSLVHRPRHAIRFDLVPSPRING